MSTKKMHKLLFKKNNLMILPDKNKNALSNSLDLFILKSKLLKLSRFGKIRALKHLMNGQSTLKQDKNLSSSMHLKTNKQKNLLSGDKNKRSHNKILILNKLQHQSRFPMQENSFLNNSLKLKIYLPRDQFLESSQMAVKELKLSLDMINREFYMLS